MPVPDALRNLMDLLEHTNVKRAFVPMDPASMGGAPVGAPPPGGPPPGGDPGMGGAPPSGDPSMMGGMPPGDPGMMPPGPPVDPGMDPGAVPQDPGAGGGPQMIQVSVDDLMQFFTMVQQQSAGAAPPAPGGAPGVPPVGAPPAPAGGAAPGAPAAAPGAPAEGAPKKGGGAGAAQAAKIDMMISKLDQFIGYLSGTMGGPPGGAPPAMGGGVDPASVGQSPTMPAAPGAPAGGMVAQASDNGQSRARDLVAILQNLQSGRR